MIQLQIDPAAAVVLLTDGIRCLTASRRHSDDWGLPGGKVEKGEPPLQAAIREFEEETGWKLKPEQLHAIYCGPDSTKSKRPNAPVIAYVCYVPHGDPSVSDFHSALYANSYQVEDGITIDNRHLHDLGVSSKGDVYADFNRATLTQYANWQYANVRKAPLIDDATIDAMSIERLKMALKRAVAGKSVSSAIPPGNIVRIRESVATANFLHRNNYDYIVDLAMTNTVDADMLGYVGYLADLHRLTPGKGLECLLTSHKYSITDMPTEYTQWLVPEDVVSRLDPEKIPTIEVEVG